MGRNEGNFQVSWALEPVSLSPGLASALVSSTIFGKSLGMYLCACLPQSSHGDHNPSYFML